MISSSNLISSLKATSQCSRLCQSKLLLKAKIMKRTHTIACQRAATSTSEAWRAVLVVFSEKMTGALKSALNVGWSLTEQNTFRKNYSCDTITSPLHRNVPANSNSGHFTKFLQVNWESIPAVGIDWYMRYIQCFLLCDVFRLSFLFLLFFSPPSPSSSPLAPSFIISPPSILETNVYEYNVYVLYIWLNNVCFISFIHLLATLHFGKKCMSDWIVRQNIWW